MKASFRLIRCLLGIGLVVAGAGCLSRPPLAHQSFALDLPRLSPAASEQGRGVLALRRVEVSPLFASRSLVYRTGESTYEQDPYAQWLVLPDRMIELALREGLRSSGVAADVVEPGSALQTSQQLEVQVAELYGDFRPSQSPLAVFSLRFRRLEGSSGPALQLSWHREYRQQVPLVSRSAEELVAGWNRALETILSELAADWNRAQ